MRDFRVMATMASASSPAISTGSCDLSALRRTML
jgi:hypothetical protein